MKEDIEAVQEGCTCPDLEMVKSEIQQIVTASDKLTTAKQVQMQVSHSRMFRVGMSTLVYAMADAAATDSVLTGLQKVMDNANLTNDLRIRAESSIIEVSHAFLNNEIVFSLTLVVLKRPSTS